MNEEKDKQFNKKFRIAILLFSGFTSLYLFLFTYIIFPALSFDPLELNFIQTIMVFCGLVTQSSFFMLEMAWFSPEKKIKRFELVFTVILMILTILFLFSIEMAFLNDFLLFYFLISLLLIILGAGRMIHGYINNEKVMWARAFFMIEGFLTSIMAIIIMVYLFASNTVLLDLMIISLLPGGISIVLYSFTMK